jgi:hypothetical protein
MSHGMLSTPRPEVLRTDEALNSTCVCTSLDRKALEHALERELGEPQLIALVKERCPHLAVVPGTVIFSVAFMAQSSRFERAQGRPRRPLVIQPLLGPTQPSVDLAGRTRAGRGSRDRDAWQ